MTRHSPENPVAVAAAIPPVASAEVQEVLAVLPAGVIVLNASGCIEQANRLAQELLGMPLPGQPWLQVVQQAFAPRRDDGHEVSLRNGRRVSLSTSSLAGGRGQLILLQDLTETRRLQGEVARYERLSSMGRMVASLAHQLRTPLSTALIYAGHLQKENLDSGQRQKFASKLSRRLQHMERQIRDMLIFARGETHMAQRLSGEQLVQALQEAINPVVERHHLTFHWALHPLVCDLVVSLDSLVGAVLNLVNNAIESSEPPPEITLHLEAVQDLPGHQGVHLLLCVADTGQGMSEEKLAQAQEPFFTSKAQGTGLGLAIVRAVIDAHNGRFWLQSSPGAGTRAWIALPAEPLTEPAAETS